jgi:hypothetical protein
MVIIKHPSYEDAEQEVFERCVFNKALHFSSDFTDLTERGRSFQSLVLTWENSLSPLGLYFVLTTQKIILFGSQDLDGLCNSSILER